MTVTDTASSLSGISYLALAVIMLAVVVLIVQYATKKAPRSLNVFTGPPGAGKTVLCYQLAQECLRETIPSMHVNELHVNSPAGSQIIIDYPGHASLSLGLGPFLEQAKQVFFVLDSSDEPSLIHVAKSLYFVLTHPTVYNHRIPVSVVCNKCDLDNALPIDTIACSLEKEINSIEDAEESMQDIDSTKQKKLSLRIDNESFKFSKCRSRVSFGTASGNTGNTRYALDQL